MFTTYNVNIFQKGYGSGSGVHNLVLHKICV